jgi:hypothetical protein
VIKFVARVRKHGKLLLGIVLLPADVAGLLGGFSDKTSLEKIGVDDPVLDGVAVYFFRDEKEFQDAMREAGVEQAMLETVGGL